MRNRAAMWLCVGFGALAALLPLGQLVAQGDAPPPPPAPNGPVEGPLVPPSSNLSMPNPPHTPANPKEAVPTMMVNSRRIRLNYGLSDVGPSGVASVELWATRDGRTWQCYSNEPPPSGPLVVHVAEEGRYGFFLVVKSGVGTRSPAPRPGDKAQVWVEVDETLPVVKLTDVHVGKGPHAGNLMIAWSATDAHLMPRPITISLAPSKDGPWTPVASHLENTGRHAWKMPKEMPYQFFVKVEAADRAGNVGNAFTHEPVKVDLARPRGTILGVDLDAQPAPTAQSPAATPALNNPVTLAR